MTRIEATPDESTGYTVVRVLEIPEGYETASVYRAVDGATSTLADNTNVIDNQVTVVDYAAPPGWAVTYSATVRSSRGANLAVDPGFESGTFVAPWSSQGQSRHVRSDGSAHTGDYYLRGTTAGAGLITAPAAAMIPGYIGAANFESTTPVAFVDTADGSYIRSTGPTGTATDFLTVQYKTLLPYTNNTALLARLVARTSTSGRHASPSLRITTRYCDAGGVQIAFWTTVVQQGEIPDWTSFVVPIEPKSHTGATQIRLEVTFAYMVPGGQNELRGWTEHEFLDLGYMQLWAASSSVPTAYTRTYQQVPVTPNTTYRADVWARKAGRLPSASHVSVDVGFLNSAGQPTGTATAGAVAPLTAEWNMYSSNTGASPTDAVEARVSVRAYGSAAGADPAMGDRYDLDDLYVTDLRPLEQQADPVTATLPARYAGDAWIKDTSDDPKAIRTMVAEQPSLERAGRVGAHQVVGRSAPIVVSDVRSTATGELRLITRDKSERDELLELLAPGRVLLFQTTPEALLPADMYVMIDGATEERVAPHVQEQWRFHALSFIIVDPPEHAEATIANTYGDVKTYGASYNYVLTSRGTYLAVLSTTFNPNTPARSAGAVRV